MANHRRHGQLGPAGAARGALRATALLLIATAAMAQRQAGDISKLPARAPDAKVAYGPAPQQFAELRLPQGKGPFPVVAILHGGCWIDYADASYTAHLATELT